MTTHEVEEMLDITKKTLIYYENEGLVKPSRDNNNYRCYNQDDISKIKFILLLREMDVTIEEIKQIINKQKSIRDVLENKKDLIKQRRLDLDHIDEKINNYIKRKKVLNTHNMQETVLLIFICSKLLLFKRILLKMCL